MKTIYNKLLFFLLMLPLSVLAQATLEGIVVDSKSNAPIPGVNIVVQGTQSGVSTDIDGKFKIGKLKKGDKLVVSFVGYQTQTVTFEGQKSITISMSEEANTLQEVVVQVGYGSVKKKDATGSVAVLGTKDFNKGAMVTTENLLNGRVAGVTINTGGGAPGSGSQIRIRGGSSLNASNDPLIVVDNFPISNTTNTGSTSFLASLNPNDIESISVLKDASATAIYGSRASNGVILITTKKGGKKLSVDFNTQYGSGSSYNKIDVYGANDFRNLVARVYPGEVSKLGTANTDWQDAIYRRTDYIDTNVSLRGNLFGKIPARLSMGNTYQEGLRLTNKFNRNTISATLNPSFLNDHLKFRLNANYTNEGNRFADGVEGSAITFDPTQPIYDASSPFGGFFEYRNGNNLTPNVQRNPVAQLLMTYDTGKNNRFYGNIETEYKLHFLPSVKAVINMGFDEANGERTRLVGANAASGPSNNNVPYGTNEYTEQTIRTKMFDSYLTYNKKFGKLNIDAQAGYSYQIYQSTRFYTRNILQPNYASIGAETDIDTDNVLIGFFGRAVLNYDDKYLLTVNMRRDGTSRFSEANRWLNTPGVAFAWKLKEEFFKDNGTLSDLKLRLGWGVTGQQNVDDAAFRNYYLQQYGVGNNTNQYYFGTIATPIAISKPYNPNLKWEKTTTYNVGLDFGIYNNRITGTIDAFYKKTDDLISKVAFSDGGNFTNRGYANIGSFNTKGFEVGLNADIIKGKDITWNVSVNATKFERRIESLASGFDVLYGDAGAGTGSTALIHREGYTPGSFFVYKQLYNNAGQPIEGAFADLNGDGIINGDDRYIYKNPDPDITFGFASTFNYKNLDFGFNLRASLGNRVYNAVNATRAQYNLIKNNGVLSNVPTNVESTNFNNTADVYLSDLYVENGSFLRMDNITLGYTFPKWLEGKASLRLFTGMQNAFIITKYSGLDPEVNNGGIDNTIYPRQRTVLFGVNMKF